MDDYRAKVDVRLVDSAGAAEVLGITPRRVRALAVSRGLGWQTARDWVFTPEEVESMRERTPGRPVGTRRHTYTIETTPSWVEPPYTFSNRAAAEREARAIARDAGTSLDSVRVVDENEHTWLWLRRNPEGDRWYRAETGE